MHSQLNKPEQPVHYYDILYRDGNPHDHLQPVYNAALLMIDKLDQPVNVLEIGCGTGIFGKMVYDAGYRYRGFDFSVEAIRQCPHSIRTLVSRRNAYNRSSYRLNHNVIVALEVMEHVQDLKIVEMISSGTICIFSLPNFTDAAHLRTYKTDKFIRKYYKGLIRWHKIEPIIMADDDGIECGKKIIHVCKGVRV